GIRAEGSFSAKEFGGPKELFARLDRNGDGVVNAEDFDWSERSAYLRQTMPAQMLFRRIDRDSNGRVSKAEWEALYKQLAGEKGYVTPEDLSRLFQPPARPTSPPPGAGMPPAKVLIKGVFEGELGSISEGPGLNNQGPDFTLPTFDGKGKIGLADYRGHKPVVLIFGSFS